LRDFERSTEAGGLFGIQTVAKEFRKESDPYPTCPATLVAAARSSTLMVRTKPFFTQVPLKKIKKLIDPIRRLGVERTSKLVTGEQKPTRPSRESPKSKAS